MGLAASKYLCPMLKALNPLLNNRAYLFWTLHISGWLGYAIAQYLGTLLYENKYEHMKGYTVVIAVAAVSGFLLTWNCATSTGACGPNPTRPDRGCAAELLPVRAGLARHHQFHVPAVHPGFVEWVMKSPLEFFSNAMSSTYLLLCWTGLYFGFRYYESAQQQREATLRAVTLAQEAQLKMLRYQLNPHFLFNTLNAISTLILDSENRTANQAVMRLSEFLRYTLDQDPMKKVTLRQEIEAMNLYLTTEKLRFGERLRLEFAVEERALEALVPSLLLQPLIENAVKFAVSPSEKGGNVRIEGRVRGSMLELVVADDGPGLNTGAAPGAGRGVGLRNSRERLAVLYGDNHRFATLDNKPGLRIELGLPLEMEA